MLSPDCPACGHPPRIMLGSTQAFCGNDECLCIAWNPSLTPAQNRADPQVLGLDEGIWSTCPSCGTDAVRTPYDIGSGRELACASCEWCWGADGQDLKPIDVEGTRRWAEGQGPGA